MSEQEEFFNFYGNIPTPKKLARSGDPITSKLAAERAVMFLSNHERRIYNALLVDLEDGTSYEIADACGLTEAQVFRRLSEMEKKHYIFRTGKMRPSPSGCLCHVWAAT